MLIKSIWHRYSFFNDPTAVIRSLSSGASESAVAALRSGELPGLLKRDAEVGNDYHLRDPFTRFDGSCHFAVVVQSDNIIASVVRITYSRAVGGP